MAILNCGSSCKSDNDSKSLRTFIAVGSVEGRGRGLESLERETVDHGMVERWIGVMDLGIVE